MKVLRLFLLAALALAVGSPGAAGAAATKKKCTDPLGCVVVKKGDAIQLATLLAADFGEFSDDMRRGAELALDLRGGTIAGQPVELHAFDDRCFDGPSGGGAAAHAVLDAVRDLVGVIGTTCSRAALGAGPVLADAGVPMVSPSNTSPLLTEPDTHPATYMRTAYNDRWQGVAMGAYAGGEGVGDATIVEEESTYSSFIADEFAAAYGGPTARLLFEGDVEAVVAELAANPPELAFLTLADPEAATVIVARAREEAALDDTTFAVTEAAVFGFIERAGPSAEGVLAVTPDFDFQTELYQDVVLPEYTARYGEPTGTFHAHAFDALELTARAIESVAYRDGKKLYIPRQALIDALFATTGLEGATGVLECSPLGECNPNHPFAIWRIEAGELVRIG